MTSRLLWLAAALLTISASTNTLNAQSPTPSPEEAPADTSQISATQDPETELIGPVYDSVSTHPVLIGGPSGLLAGIDYSEVARRAQIEGKVHLEFVVDKNGDVRNAIVLQGIGGVLDEEALRAIQTAKFEPGRLDGQVVNTRQKIVLSFNLH